MKENSIIINKRYFNNIEKAVNSLNQFFSSNFQQKNLLKVDDVSDLDEGMKNVLESIDTVDSRWVTEPELVADAADKLNEAKEDVKEYIMDKEDEGQDFLSYCENKGDTSLFNTAKEFLSFKALEQISDNMQIFEKLLNGIYSFELFTTPSKYKKEIETFTQNVPKGECSDVLGDTKYSVFDIKGYVTGLFENDDIELPEDMDITKEVNRVSEFKDLDPNVKVTVNESITEAAEVNYFASTKPSHIKYAKGKWQVSTQFEKVVDDLITGLRKCDSSDDLKSFIESKASTYTKTLEATVFPFILVQAFIKKANITATKYADSYKSIVSKNGGAKRFENYDIFTTFKSDKEGTLKFISDFCKLKLVNDPRAKIANNTLLTLFNIFDSRIYFDIMYNMIPDKEKKDKGMDEDSFVRKHRAIINNNSRGSNPYQKEINTDDTESTSGEIKEQVYDMFRSMGDMSISDMELCESWHDMLHDEIKTVDDALYNAGIPITATCEYIGESFNVAEGSDDDNKDVQMSKAELSEDAIQETDDGSIPEYMKTRMKMSDENGNTRQATITTAEVPSNDGNVPSNSIDDLAMSIDAKINAGDDDINDVIGKEAKSEGSHIVYNVTNNYTYTNSFNKTTHADLSQNKHVDNSVHADKTADLSNTNKSNNKYNSTGSSDTKDTLKVQEFSTGYSVEEVFAFLGSEEPLLEASGTKPPKEDSLTKAMDRDRKTLPKQQAAKKAVNKAVGTAKAVTKPVSRTKQWLLGIVDSLVKRREDKVKADIIENPSYRTALFKACRIALKIGLTGVAFTISKYLGAAYLLLQASDAYDKQRLRKEVEREFATEMKILDKKIQLAEQDDTPESRQALYKMMRLRSKMEQIATKEAVGTKFVHPTASQ